MSKATQTLERAALDAHRRGLSWGEFWDEHGRDVCRAEPHDRRKFNRLVCRLLALLVSGNEDGAESGEPWILDAQPNQPSPHDSISYARCQLPLWPLPGAVEHTR
jgi:hypothetical protein